MEQNVRAVEFSLAQLAQMARMVDLKETQVGVGVVVKTEIDARGSRHSNGSVWEADPSIFPGGCSSSAPAPLG